jgi:hypothetical protein
MGSVSPNDLWHVGALERALSELGSLKLKKSLQTFKLNFKIKVNSILNSFSSIFV